jgi:hypothetical protein
MICPSREYADALISHEASRVVPEGFRVWLPRQPSKNLVHQHAAAGAAIWPLLRATERGRQAVGDFLERHCQGRRPLVITLRCSASSHTRNSRMDQWAAFVESLDRSRYTPIFVHDSEAPMDDRPVPLDRELFCEAARWNLEIRMALYEAAWLNLAVMHGPMELCWYNERARYLLFLEIGAHPSSSERIIAEGGQPIRRDLAFATPFQHIVWQSDDAANIRTAFEDMARKLEHA